MQGLEYSWLSVATVKEGNHKTNKKIGGGEEERRTERGLERKIKEEKLGERNHW